MTLELERGPAEAEARRLTRESYVNDSLAITMLARLIDDTRRDLAEHMKDCPHVQRPIPLQVLERNGHPYIDLR